MVLDTPIACLDVLWLEVVDVHGRTISRAAPEISVSGRTLIPDPIDHDLFQLQVVQAVQVGVCNLGPPVIQL